MCGRWWPEGWDTLASGDRWLCFMARAKAAGQLMLDARALPPGKSNHKGRT